MFDIAKMGQGLTDGLEELNTHLKNIERFSAALLVHTMDDEYFGKPDRGTEAAFQAAYALLAEPTEPKGADDATS
jgi:hypothetical protein